MSKIIKQETKRKQETKESKPKPPALMGDRVQKPSMSTKDYLLKSPVIMGKMTNTASQAFAPNHNGSKSGTYITQHTDVEEMLSALDQMNLAKLSPGSFNAPYVASAIQVPISGINFQVARTAESCFYYERNAIRPIGEAKYLMILYCPLFSSTVDANNDKRCGGYVCIQFDSPSTVAILPDMFLTQTTSGGDAGGLWMESLYGSDGSQFANGGYVWAGQISTALAIPAATVAGIVYEGNFQVRQWYDVNNNLVFFGADQLIKIATSVRKMSPDEQIVVTQKVGVVNHDLLYDSPNKVTPGNKPDLTAYSSEIVSWAIIQTPSVSITGGSNTPFTLAQSIRGNYVFFPRFSDPFTNNLFRGTEFSKVSCALNDHFSKSLQPIAHLPTSIVTKEVVHAVQEYAKHVSESGDIPVKHQDSIAKKIWDAAKSVGGFVQEYGPALMHVASMLRTVTPGQTLIYVPAMRDRLRYYKDYVSHIGHVSPTIDSLTTQLIKELDLTLLRLQFQGEYAEISILQNTPHTEDSKSEEYYTDKSNSFKNGPGLKVPAKNSSLVQAESQGRVLEPEEWCNLDLDGDRSFISSDVFRVGSVLCRIPKA